MRKITAVLTLCDGTPTDDKNRAPLYIPPPPPEEDEEIFSAVERGINFDRYDKIPVEVTGTNAPKMIETFEEAGLTETVAVSVAFFCQRCLFSGKSAACLRARRPLMWKFSRLTSLHDCLVELTLTSWCSIEPQE